MQQNFVSDLLKKPAWMLFLISWLLYLVGLFLFSHMVWDANTYMADFKGADFETSLSNWRKMDMLRYVFSPAWILGISTVIFFLIKSGLNSVKLSYSKSFFWASFSCHFLFGSNRLG